MARLPPSRLFGDFKNIDLVLNVYNHLVKTHWLYAMTSTEQLNATFLAPGRSDTARDLARLASGEPPSMNWLSRTI
jgi:hypothetical protein